MSGISTQISMVDNMTPILNTMYSMLNNVNVAFAAVQTTFADDLNMRGVEVAQSEVEALRSKIEQLNQVEWISPQNLEIFNGNDAERFTLEVQSANDMLSRLMFTQEQISVLAQNMSLLPPNAISDIGGMSDRIAALQSQIDKVHKSRIEVVGVEKANAEVEQLRGHLSTALAVQEDMNAALQNLDASGANRAYQQLNNIINSTEKNIRDNIHEQQAFNNELRSGEEAAKGLKGMIASVVGVLSARVAFSWGKGAVDAANQEIQANQQLLNVLANQGASYEDYIALKEKAASIQSDGMFSETSMIGAAAELSTYVSDAEALQSMMSTLSNYAAGMSGGAAVDYQEMVKYAEQLGKALDGNMQGLNLKGFSLTDAQKEIIEFGSEMERALVIDEVINQSWANLYEQMSNTPTGQIEQIKNSFDDIRSSIGVQLLPVVMMLFTTIQGHMPQIEALFQALIPPIQYIIGLIGQMIEVAFIVAQVIGDNWGWIEPIIWAIVAAFIAWKVITIALNTALLANPITLIIVGIVALVAAIITLIQRIGGLHVAWLYAMHGIQTAWDFLKIGFFTGVNFVLDLWARMKLGMQTAGTAIANFMGDMKSNVLMILQNMVNGAIDIINGFIGTLNKLPFVSIDTIQQVQFGTMAQTENEAAKQARDNALSQYQNEIEQGIAERAALREQMVVDAQNAMGERLAEIHALRNATSEEEATVTIEQFLSPTFGGGNGSDTLERLGRDVSDIAANTGTMANISGENLKYWRDIAERDSINRFTTARVNVRIAGIHNTVRNEMDLDNVIDYITEGVEESLETTAERVNDYV